jgi:hypothetical protein
MCTISININNADFPTFAGAMHLGLPFTAGNAGEYHAPSIYFYPLGNWTSGSNFTGWVPITTGTRAYMSFMLKNVDTDRQTALLSTNTSLSGASGLYLRFSMTYITA